MGEKKKPPVLLCPYSDMTGLNVIKDSKHKYTVFVSGYIPRLSSIFLKIKNSAWPQQDQHSPHEYSISCSLENQEEHSLSVPFFEREMSKIISQTERK